MLNTKRIESVLDVATLAAKKIVVIGVGGGSFLARQMARCGIKHLRLVDPQKVDAENICRQVYQESHIDTLKVEASWLVSARTATIVSPRFVLVWTTKNCVSS